MNIGINTNSYSSLNIKAQNTAQSVNFGLAIIGAKEVQSARKQGMTNLRKILDEYTPLMSREQKDALKTKLKSLTTGGRKIL